MKFLLCYIMIPALFVFAACNDQRTQCGFERHFTKEFRDTLMVDMVTLIGKKPKTADFASRFDPQYRTYYVRLSGDFAMKYFHQADDTCYYYMIRPAKSPKGNTRGVGGKFTLNDQNRIEYFEESFNTPVYPVEILERMGWRLFRELITEKSIEGLLWNDDYIEWPDSRLRYDVNKQEWRYDTDDADSAMQAPDQ